VKRWLHAILCSIALLIGLSWIAVLAAVALVVWMTK
jgi:hypothetical protein